MSKIIIERLKIFANHGVFEEEKANGQNFYISCEYETFGEVAKSSDALENTISYAEVCDNIKKFVTQNNFNLIETLGDQLVLYLLNAFPSMRRCKVRVDKPEAPIPEEFATVAYETERTWNTVYLSYGSNLGDSHAIIKDAIEKLENHSCFRLMKNSSLIVTKPYGGVEQDDFLNGCLVGMTCLDPFELLDLLHKMEQEANRVRLVHWGPRTLDLDIVLYDDYIIHSENLIIPHIDMQNRDFVLKPLNEIAPYAYHPILQKTVSELLKELEA